MSRHASEETAVNSHKAAADYLSKHEHTLRSDDAMVAAVVGGILTLAFVVLVAVMLAVNLWTFSSVN